jgi:hypothetical protein
VLGHIAPDTAVLEPHKEHVHLQVDSAHKMSAADRCTQGSGAADAAEEEDTTAGSLEEGDKTVGHLGHSAEGESTAQNPGVYTEHSAVPALLEVHSHKVKPVADMHSEDIVELLEGKGLGSGNAVGCSLASWPRH